MNRIITDIADHFHYSNKKKDMLAFGISYTMQLSYSLETLSLPTP